MSDKFNIVQFQAASGLPLTGDFIVKTLGVLPDETVKRAMFWDAGKYGTILGRLQNFLNGKGAANPCDFSALRPKKDEAPAPKPAPAADEPFEFGETPADSDEAFEFGETEDANDDEGFF